MNAADLGIVNRPSSLEPGPYVADCCLLSIITINLNNACCLPRTISSLQHMKGDKDFEFIFVDGGSLDQSVGIAEKFYEPGNLVSEPDEGIYHAMNKGLRMAKGVFVLWLNSGDELICTPIALKALLSRMRSSDVSLISCSSEVCYENEPWRNRVHYPSISDLPNKTIPHQAAFFRRIVVFNYGGYDQKFRVVGDRDLILRIYNQCPGSITFSELVTSRWYFGGITTTGSYSNEIFALRYKNGLIGIYDYYMAVLKQKSGRFFQIIFRN